MRHDLLESLVGAPPIRLPEHVRAKVTTLADASVVLEAQHDGYLRRFGVIHRRRLILAPDGLELQGFDRLGPLKGHLRLPVDLPFAVHFHVHPEVGCSAGKTAGTAELALPDGEVWIMSAAGAELSIEESVHFADLSGPRRSMQIVLRGACFGESEMGPAEAHAAD